MAQRRMFSLDIVASDAFLEMPTSSRELYFHLGMYADDDGFVSPKKIMRMVGATEDDLKILLAKRFLIVFENGVVVIKHWKMNNYIQKDRYRETVYVEQKGLLNTKDNGSYTECIQNVNTGKVRVGKVRVGKVIPLCSSTMSEEDFNTFWLAYPRKVDKSKAKAKFTKLDITLLPTILTALETQKKTEQWQKDKGQFIPHPTSWINGKRWEDEVNGKEILTDQEKLEQEARSLVAQYGQEKAYFKFITNRPSSELLKVKHIIDL